MSGGQGWPAMRLTFALVLLVAAAGCASPPDADDTIANESGHLELQGMFSKTHLQGQEVQRSGGEHDILVPDGGWRNTIVRLNSSIETILWLVPPGCEGPSAPCALSYLFDSEHGDVRWIVPSMAPGTWHAVLDLEQDKYTAASAEYTLDFDYIEA